MRLGLDAMGGDFAPAEPVRGALAAGSELAADDEIVLIGNESAIRPHLAEQNGWERFIRIEHAPAVVGMDEVWPPGANWTPSYRPGIPAPASPPPRCVCGG